MSAEASSYELQREENIRKNQAIFAELFSDHALVRAASSTPSGVPVSAPGTVRKRGRPRKGEEVNSKRQKRASTEPTRASQRAKGGEKPSTAELFAQISAVADSLEDDDVVEQGEKRAGSDDSESEGEGEGVGEGEKSAEGSKKLKTGKKRSKHGVQHSMVTMLGGQVGDKKDGAAGSGEDGEQEFIQMVPISQAQRNLTKEEKNQALSKVRHENHESGVKYGKLLTPEERAGLSIVIDKPPYYMESKLALVLDRIMDLYDTAPEFQEGKTQLTGQRAAAALRVSKLIAVRCVGYLNEKRLINYRVPGEQAEPPVRPVREERRTMTNDDLPPGIFLLGDRNQYVKNKSGYLGVRKRTDGKYEARFYGKGIKKGKFLGLFNTAREAAAAWDREAIRVRGPDTFTNLGRESALSLLAEGAVQQSSIDNPGGAASGTSAKSQQPRGPRRVMPAPAPGTHVPIVPYFPPSAAPLGMAVGQTPFLPGMAAMPFYPRPPQHPALAPALALSAVAASATAAQMQTQQATAPPPQAGASAPMP